MADILQTMISNSFLNMVIAYAKVKQIRKYILRCRLQNKSYFASTTIEHIEAEKYGRHSPDDSVKTVFYSHCP